MNSNFYIFGIMRVYILILDYILSKIGRDFLIVIFVNFLGILMIIDESDVI